VQTESETLKAADAQGMLPCHYAAMRNSLPVINTFVRYHGTTGPDDNGMTPLHYAILHVWPYCLLGVHVATETCPACRLLTQLAIGAAWDPELGEAHRSMENDHSMAISHDL
jgi:hypothetical protein